MRDVDVVCELPGLVVDAQRVPPRRLDVLLQREFRRLGNHVGIDAQLPIVREAARHRLPHDGDAARRAREQLAYLPRQMAGDETDLVPPFRVVLHELIEKDLGEARARVRDSAEIRERGRERGSARLHDVHEVERSAPPREALQNRARKGTASHG